jgi:hypothetical protein
MPGRIRLKLIPAAQKSLPHHVFAVRMPRLQTFVLARATSEPCTREILTPNRLIPSISRSELIAIEDRDSSQTQVPGLPFQRTGSRRNEQGRGHETEEAHYQAL